MKVGARDQLRFKLSLIIQSISDDFRVNCFFHGVNEMLVISFQNAPMTQIIYIQFIRKLRDN